MLLLNTPIVLEKIFCVFALVMHWDLFGGLLRLKTNFKMNHVPHYFLIHACFFRKNWNVPKCLSLKVYNLVEVRLSVTLKTFLFWDPLSYLGAFDWPFSHRTCNACTCIQSNVIKHNFKGTVECRLIIKCGYNIFWHHLVPLRQACALMRASISPTPTFMCFFLP